MADVFISHVEEDGDVAETIAGALEAAGYTTWYYERDSLPGISYLLQTAGEIEGARAVLLIVSPDSIRSGQVTKEVVRGHESGKPFIPVLRSMSHEQFQAQQPEWRQAMGAAASIPIPAEGVSAVLPRILSGVRALRLVEAPSDRELVGRPVEPGELLRVTALSAEVVGADLLAARLPQEELDALMAECRTTLVRAIEDHGGVALPGSTGVLGVFGFPSAHEDDPERAARAALRIVEAILALSSDVRSAWEVAELAARVGIATGPLGGEELSPPATDAPAHYGPTARMAALLRDAAPPGAIVVSDESARRLKPRFLLEAWEWPEAPPVPAHRLVKETEAPRPHVLPRLVDRTRELSALGESLEELLVGRGQILLMMGKAGIGKSRLLAELRGRAEQRGVTWLEGRCLSYGDSLTYWPFVEVLRTYLGVAEGEAEVAVRLRLHARTKAILADRAVDVLPYLGRLLSLRLDPDQAEKVQYLPPEALAEQIHRAYRAWLLALAARAPVVVAIEDLHWADPSTRALAEALLEAAEESPVGVVAAFRDDPDTEAWRFRLRVAADYSHRVREVVPAALTDAEGAELAGSIATPGEIDQEALSSIVARAEGNPLYLEQLLRSVIEARPGPGETAAGPTLQQLPPALEGLLVSRIDQLPAGARRLAQVAAVAGRSFLRRVLDRVMEDQDIDRDLVVLLKAGIVRELRRIPELEYIFTHGLIQDAAASTLAAWRRREIHGRVAEALVDLFAAGLDDYLEIIAHHFAESEDRGRALEYGERAGDKAAALYANDQAIDLWQRARDIAVELDDEPALRRITEKLAQLLLRVMNPRSVALYEELAESASEPEDAARLLAEAAFASVDLAEEDQAAALVDRGLALGEISPVAQARLLQGRARIAARRVRDQELRSVLEVIERVAEGELPAALAMQQAHLWDLYFSIRGDHAGAQRWAERYLELAEGAGDPLRVLEAKHNLAVSMYRAGDLLGEKRMLEEVYAQAHSMGYVRVIVAATTNLTSICHILGELELGKGYGSEADRLASDPFFHGLALVNLSEIEREMAETDTARAHLEEALRLAARAESEEVSIEASIDLASLSVLDERASGTEGPFGAEGNEGTLREAIGRAEALEEPFLAAAARSWLAELYLRRRQPERAEAEARVGLEEAERAGPDHAVPLRRLLGVALEVRDPGSGRETLEAALDSARSLGMKLEEGKILAALAAHGLVPEPHRAMAEARSILQGCGSVRDVAEIERDVRRSEGTTPVP